MYISLIYTKKGRMELICFEGSDLTNLEFPDVQLIGNK